MSEETRRILSQLFLPEIESADACGYFCRLCGVGPKTLLEIVEHLDEHVRWWKP
jgi:hypothetical protein